MEEKITVTKCDSCSEIILAEDQGECDLLLFVAKNKERLVDLCHACQKELFETYFEGGKR